MSYQYQEEYCKNNKLPLFAPEICFICKNKFGDIIEEKSKKELITHCPICNKSFI
jgi:hypothetical protein